MRSAPGDSVALYDAWRGGRLRRLPDGFWRNPANARAVLEALLAREGYSLDDAPRVCRTSWLRAHASTLCRVYRGSPYLLLTTLYPGRFRPADFPEWPKADDLQEGAFVAEGMDRPAHAYQRWTLSRRRRHERQGLCEMCMAPRAPGSRYCAEHAERLRASQRARYAEMRRAGICFRCRTRPAERQGMCPPCYSLYLRAKARRYRRLYWRRRAEGRCVRAQCREPASPGHVYCEGHLAAQRERYRRSNYRDRARRQRAARRAKEGRRSVGGEHLPAERV